MKETLKRYSLFLLSVWIIGLGISMVTQSNLGTTAITSLPYVFSILFSWSFGAFTMLANILWVLLQIIILRKDFEKKQYIQFFVGPLLGISLDINGLLLHSFQTSPYLARLIFVLEAAALNVKKVDLETLFKESEVVSLHTPLLPETTGMITGKHIQSMKPHTTFINTARGAIVKENDMIAVLKERTDLTAVLDVTHPEPPEKDFPLYEMENIILTPHIAGSLGSEVGRMGEYMLQELKQYLAAEPLKYQITKEKYQLMA